MLFDPLAFYAGFLDYLRRDRASTLAYASVIASPEHWVQFEALDWLHRNRTAVGLAAVDSRRPACDVLAETRKNDIWLQDGRGTPNRAGIGIEFKVIYNNKNFLPKIKELRENLGLGKRLADGFDPGTVQRLGVAILIYVRYLKGCEGEFTILRSTPRGNPCSTDEFRDRFLAECRSGTAGTARPQHSCQ